MHEQSPFPAQPHLVKDCVCTGLLRFLGSVRDLTSYSAGGCLLGEPCDTLSAVQLSRRSPRLKVPSSKEAFLSNKSWRWIWPEDFSFMSPLVLNWILITSRALYRCKFPLVDHDMTVMSLCNLSWVSHTRTISGCTEDFSKLLYQKHLVRTFVIICLSGCWVVFFFCFPAR